MCNAAAKRWIFRGASALVFLLAALAGPARAAIRFDVFGSPTEVINTGRSEVLGSINLIVSGPGGTTGTSSGGPVQIGFIFDHPALEIDNDSASGILLYISPGLAAANPTLTGIENRRLGGRCVGFMTLNLAPGATPAEGDFIRIEGIRGRIDLSDALTPGTDLFVDLQSVNDPAANAFFPDRLRVAKSFEGLAVEVASNAAGFQIRVAERFERAFVDRDAGDDGIGANDRVDSAGGNLGAPANSTEVIIELDGIPGGVSGIAWPQTSSASAATGAVLRLQSSSFSPGVSRAVYSFEAADQTGSSDRWVESFAIMPGFVFTGGDCNTGNLSANVTLGPAAESATACAAPDPEAARPRFSEPFALLIHWLDPASVTVGGPEFTLKIHGAGFTPEALVLWDGFSLPTTWISRSLLEAQVPAGRIARAGTATVAITSSSSYPGRLSNPASVSITAHALSLFFPRLAAGGNPEEITGIALVNFSGRTVSLTLTAYDRQGAPITGSGIVNPATLVLTAGEQLAKVDDEIFGAGLREAGRPGWIRLEGDVPGIAGFFLNFDGSLTRLDGADVSGTALASFVFPVADAGASIAAANPGEEPADIRLRLIGADGTVRAESSRTVAPAGLLLESVRGLFPGAVPDPTDYLRADSSAGVVAYENFGPEGRDPAGLNAQDAGARAFTLYAPQYAVGGRDWQSMLSVVNLDADPGSVSFRFIADDGTQIGAIRTLPIAGLGKISITAQDFFLDPGNTLVQGAVEVVGNDIRIAGNVTFGSRSAGGFLTALPLVAAGHLRSVFSQVASDANFYTGLAIMNPGADALPVLIRVFDRSGRELASKVEDLPGHGRLSRLLTEYFPALADRPVAGGYIVVEAVRNLAAFAVFGSRNLAALCAIPPQFY